MTSRPEFDVTLDAETVRLVDADGEEFSITGNNNLEIAIAEDTLNGLDVSGATVTVTDDTNFTTALTDTDPISATDSGTGSANAAQLDLGSLRKDVDVHVNTSGDATLTVEVSTDASTWREFDTVSYTGGDVRMEQYEIAYRHVRAYLNQNRTLVELASKGTD